MPDDLVTLAEAARRVRLSPQRVRKLAAKDPAFPPQQVIGGYRLVSWSAFERWDRDRNRRPGRPPKRR